MPVQKECDDILREPCMYTLPPLMFLGGHSFCPCVCKAIRVAYVGGYKAAKEGREPEVGIQTANPTPAEPEGLK